MGNHDFDQISLGDYLANTNNAGDADGKTYYDGKGSNLMTINVRGYGIVGADVNVDVNGEVKGTSGAVRSSGSVRFWQPRTAPVPSMPL